MSSLASVLLKGAKDSALDDIFGSSAGSSKTLAVAKPAAVEQKGSESQTKAGKSKSSKHALKKQNAPPAIMKLLPTPPKIRSRDDSDSDSDSEEASRPAKRRKQAPAPLKAQTSAKPLKHAKPSDDGDSSSDDESSDDDLTTPLQHVSITGEEKASRSAQKKSFAPEDETQQQRDARTIFVGNLPVEAAKSKLARKQLGRHLLASIPNAKVESIRFRSVAFQNPTSSIADKDTDDLTNPRRKSAEDLSTKDRRQRERAGKWRDDKGDETDAKKFLTPAEKKKIAFIHKDLHDDAASVTAYVMFAYLNPSREGKDAPSPIEVAETVVKTRDNTAFMERTIRVDHVGEKRSAETDPKRSIFVGSLDFAAKDEDLRVFFESLLTTERGPAEDDKAWVTRVRIVRDANTQLGKGFAYVEFLDRECVDEVLALEELRLKFAKRKLRVQRCKAKAGPVVAAASSRPGHARSKDAPAAPNRSVEDHEVRAAALAELSKDERKASKAADEDRAARRMAKKKARNELTRQQNRRDNKDVRAKDILGKKRSSMKAHKGDKPGQRRGKPSGRPNGRPSGKPSGRPNGRPGRKPNARPSGKP